MKKMLVTLLALTVLGGTNLVAAEEIPTQTQQEVTQPLDLSSHVIQEINEGGALLTLADGAQWEISLPWRWRVAGWSAGDIVTLQCRIFRYGFVMIENKTKGNNAYGILTEACEASNQAALTVASIDLERGVVQLSNHYTLQTQKVKKLQELLWKEGDVIFVLVNDNSEAPYALWNMTTSSWIKDFVVIDIPDETEDDEETNDDIDDDEDDIETDDDIQDDEPTEPAPPLT